MALPLQQMSPLALFVHGPCHGNHGTLPHCSNVFQRNKRLLTQVCCAIPSQHARAAGATSRLFSRAQPAQVRPLGVGVLLGLSL